MHERIEQFQVLFWEKLHGRAWYSTIQWNSELRLFTSMSREERVDRPEATHSKIHPHRHAILSLLDLAFECEPSNRTQRRGRRGNHRVGGAACDRARWTASPVRHISSIARRCDSHRHGVMKVESTVLRGEQVETSALSPRDAST
jgi:hypothetical protein